MTNPIKDIIEEVKTIMSQNPNLDNKDKEMLVSLMKILKTQLKQTILEECMNNSEDYQNAINVIQTKIREVSDKLTTIEDNNEKELFIEFKIQLENMVERLIAKDYKGYVGLLAEDAKNGQDFVNECSRVLSSGYDADRGFFEKRLFNMDEQGQRHVVTTNLDDLFEVISNEDLMYELSRYVQAKKNIEKDKETIEKAKETKDKIKLILEHGEDINKFEILCTSLLEYLDDMVVYTNMQSKLKARKAKLKANRILEVLNASELRDIDEDLDEVLANIDDLHFKFEEKTALKKKLIGTGLGDVIEFADPASTKLFRVSVDSSLGASIKTNFGKNSSYETVKDKIAKNYEIRTEVEDDRIAKTNEQLHKDEAKFNGVKSSLTETASRLIEADPEAVDAIVQLDSSKKESKSSKTPIVAAYLLKAYADSKDISVDELYSSIDGIYPLDRIIADYMKFADALGREEIANMEEAQDDLNSDVENMIDQDEDFSIKLM